MIEDNNIKNDLKEGFEQYWLKTLLPVLKQKEALRQKYVGRFWFLVALSLFVLPMMIIGVYAFMKYINKDTDFGIVFLAIAVFIYLIRAPYKTYKKKIKNDVMDVFINYFEGFSYHLGQGLNEEEIQKSHIFPHYTTASADDCFEGTFNDVHIRVCEQILDQIHYDAKGRSHRKIVFQGIAIELQMNKSFSGQTIVLKDSGIFNRLKKFAGLNRVKLEDIVFEKMFEVYSSDQTEARYLLTPIFMERMLDLRDLYKSKSIQFSFYDNKLLISINTKQDMFEAFSFFKSNINKAKIDTVFEQFLTIFSIIDILKLNRRIGL